MQPGSFIANLQWAEPRNGVTTDLDFYVFDLATNGLIAQSENVNATTQRPFEVMQVENATGGPRNYCVVVNKFSGGANPRLKFILSRATQISAVEYSTPTGADIIGPSIFGHNGAETAVSTAAVPYNNSGTLEDFSSYGPITITHAPVSGTTPSAALATPQVLAKPDVAATDNNRTTFFQPTGSGDFRFGGTSAVGSTRRWDRCLAAPAQPGCDARPDQAGPLLDRGSGRLASASGNRSRPDQLGRRGRRGDSTGTAAGGG